MRWRPGPSSGSYGSGDHGDDAGDPADGTTLGAGDVVVSDLGVGELAGVGERLGVREGLGGGVGLGPSRVGLDAGVGLTAG